MNTVHPWWKYLFIYDLRKSDLKWLRFWFWKLSKPASTEYNSVLPGQNTNLVKLVLLFYQCFESFQRQNISHFKTNFTKIEVGLLIFFTAVVLNFHGKSFRKIQENASAPNALFKLKLLQYQFVRRKTSVIHLWNWTVITILRRVSVTWVSVSMNYIRNRDKRASSSCRTRRRQSLPRAYLQQTNSVIRFTWYAAYVISCY